ncbi:sensor histidine kinase [Paenibacillus dokdonensis]|uniref:Sensor histidine kinase n=1 Tax=Paenibacillus dokdonensis TaxID=2567944 RepID=A0ABU6GS87_9BACL|nr:sensor histidine kinase [Paenibacillus dokdonensis]MEC0242583.1 sensor histidine kinase [Paenibacillus dokdonensis]
MKKQGRTVSISVIFIIIFIFIVTNVAYYFFTQKALIAEGDKRLDTTAEYVKQYLAQVKANHENEIHIVSQQMKTTSSLIVKAIGPNYSDYDQTKIGNLITDFGIKSLRMIPKKDQMNVNAIEIGNHEYRYQYSTSQIDYVLDFTQVNISKDKYAYVNEHLEELKDNHVNLYQGRRITLEISLLQKPEKNFVTIQDTEGYGTYQYLNDNDIPALNKAVDKEYVSYIVKVGNMKLEKYFMPIKIDQQVYMMCLISDYQIMKKVLMDQVVYYVYAIAIGSAVFLILCTLILKVFNKNKAQEIAFVHDSYENSMETINLTLKQQRHDYNNTIATIRALVTMKQYEGLHKYTEELMDDTLELNELLHMNCPPLMALLHTKHRLAHQKGVDFYYEILDFNSIPNFKYKTNDMVRVLSNLIDNSFDAVLRASNSTDDFVPQISVIGYLKGAYLIFTVRNNGDRIPDHKLELIMKPGYTSKSKGSGLGLSIVNMILEKNNGHLTCDSNEESTTFNAYFQVARPKNY